MPPATDRPSGARRRQLTEALVRAFHAYANWLVSISWKRFALLAVLLMIATSLLQELPPFSWRVTETVLEPAAGRHAHDKDDNVDIAIDKGGIHISTRPQAGGTAGPPAATAPTAPDPPAAPASKPGAGVDIRLPGDLDAKTRESLREAVQQAKEDIAQAIEDARDAADDAGGTLPGRMVERTRRVHWGDFLTDLALLWIAASIIVKATYKARVQAEAKAAIAEETAESESLKRQVMEARVAAMQAQVEPHFLFNTLASIDHLIETDAARASRMQKNLIALLRATMPTLREANAEGTRDLGRELAVIRPYLEILKMRMEERLQTRIEVSDGLLSAEFPPMMLQGLVENAIKHGLEPKPEGGTLAVRAEIVHGQLEVSVSDSGLGFGAGDTAGTGVGLANIRERLTLLYGGKASLKVAANPGGGTRVAISVPYRSVEPAHA